YLNSNLEALNLARLAKSLTLKALVIGKSIFLAFPSLALTALDCLIPLLLKRHSISLTILPTSLAVPLNAGMYFTRKTASLTHVASSVGLSFELRLTSFLVGELAVLFSDVALRFSNFLCLSISAFF